MPQSDLTPWDTNFGKDLSNCTSIPYHFGYSWCELGVAVKAIRRVHKNVKNLMKNIGIKQKPQDNRSEV